MNFPSKRIVNHAIQEANLSDYRFRLGSVVYYKDRPFGYGHNQPNKTHPRANTPYNTIHAEFDALFDAIRACGNVSGLSIYTHRLGRRGEPRNAYPCEACIKMLAWAGIKYIYYSFDDKRVGLKMF